MNETALKELIYKVADDQLIIGHRHSEWTGFGPLLEEDIAFSSMAQDKIGQSHALYSILHQLGEQPPDTLAFMRNASQFHNAIFSELPSGEYDFSLIRHFLYDTALAIRIELLASSSFQPIAALCNKIRGELRYHTMHANTWIRQLGTATEESVDRLQRSLDYAVPFALGLFEESPFEQDLIDDGVFAGERAVEQQWKATVASILKDTRLTLPDLDSLNAVNGGRTGKHSEYLQPLLDEMSEVFKIDPTAEW